MTTGVVSVLRTSERDAWHADLDRLGAAADVYFAPEYLACHEANGEGQATLWRYEEGDQLLVNPLLRHRIDPIGGMSFDDWDVETCYGYGGPAANTRDADFLGRADGAFIEDCRARGIVAEFIRFHPLLENSLYAMGGRSVTFNRETVSIALAPDEETLFAGYSADGRNMVRKARRKGVVAAVQDGTEGMEEFADLYNITMRRVGADPYYLFSRAYFDCLRGFPPAALARVVATVAGRVAHLAVLLRRGSRLHYHLVAGDPALRETAAGNLAVHEAALWGARAGCTVFHLGGGRTPDPKDSLFRFKASFSRRRHPFYVGTRVFDEAAYIRIVSLWESAYPARASDPRRFLCYRQR